MQAYPGRVGHRVGDSLRSENCSKVASVDGASRSAVSRAGDSSPRCAKCTARRARASLEVVKRRPVAPPGEGWERASLSLNDIRLWHATAASHGAYVAITGWRARSPCTVCRLATHAPKTYASCKNTWARILSYKRLARANTVWMPRRHTIGSCRMVVSLSS